MNKISCDIIQDLIPLVKDHVASEDSEKAVKEHIEHCETCRQWMTEDSLPATNDALLLKRIKERQRRTLFALLLVGVVCGFALTLDHYWRYLNILIMPFAGLLCFCLTPKHSFRLAGISTLFITILHLIVNLFTLSSFNEAFLSSVWEGLLTLFWLCLGCLIALLFYYAKKGEWPYEKK